jgi:hypothetical protein
MLQEAVGWACLKARQEELGLRLQVAVDQVLRGLPGQEVL